MMNHAAQPIIQILSIEALVSDTSGRFRQTTSPGLEVYEGWRASCRLNTRQTWTVSTYSHLKLVLLSLVIKISVWYLLLGHIEAGGTSQRPCETEKQKALVNSLCFDWLTLVRHMYSKYLWRLRRQKVACWSLRSLPRCWLPVIASTTYIISQSLRRLPTMYMEWIARVRETLCALSIALLWSLFLSSSKDGRSFYANTFAALVLVMFCKCLLPRPLQLMVDWIFRAFPWSVIVFHARMQSSASDWLWLSLHSDQITANILRPNHNAPHLRTQLQY